MLFFKQLKEKNDGAKSIFSLILALCLTVAILFVFSPFKGNNINTEVEVAENKLSSISPISVIKEEFSKVFSDIKDLKEMSSSSLEERLKEESGVEIEFLEVATSSVTSTEQLEIE